MRREVALKLLREYKREFEERPQRGTGGDSWGKGRSGALLAAYESLPEKPY